MKILYFDCFAGISGDMTLGAFLDIGADPAHLQTELAKLGVPGFHLEIEKTQKRGIGGTKCHVVMDCHEHAHRHFGDIKNIITESSLENKVKETALAIFKRVAQAEAKVHGVTMEQVHFHEVGAVDSIVDIVGAAICFHDIAPDLVYGSAVNAGQGFVKCAHGLLPVPAPATAEIIAKTDFPIYAKGVDGESATPTGMAILAELGSYSVDFPKMAVDRIGYGFGDREFEILNGLRLFLGHSQEGTSDIMVIETNIDDMTGETAGHVLEGLFEQGVRDAFYTPIYMKKNRPAFKLTVICDAAQVPVLQRYLFAETTSIGLRKYSVDRAVMSRETKTVQTPLGKVRIKVCRYDDIEKSSPEYEDLKKLSKESGKPLTEVYKFVYPYL